MSGKPSRNKGLRVEREIVNLLKGIGVEAERVPLSGSAGGSFVGDIKISTKDIDFVAEVKARKNGDGFKTLEGWLGENDFLFLKKNKTSPTAVMSWEAFTYLLSNLKGAEKNACKCKAS